MYEGKKGGPKDSGIFYIIPDRVKDKKSFPLIPA